MIEVNEPSALIKELILVFQGIDGEGIKFQGNELGYKVRA